MLKYEKSFVIFKISETLLQLNFHQTVFAKKKLLISLIAVKIMFLSVEILINLFATEWTKFGNNYDQISAYSIGIV